ncbi:SDR family oxidoreductase [Sporomusa sphaeroides]|uniref:SDR family oxidoreductase n=1 Tax=Sporomusa sphaeroides TaxID=47679 RepID=UPI002C2C4128|nr:NAD(P)H-binding protein [Sporomusa sphaeroides]HML34165.1 NAD(P)H-binding protein [Sporomusa sphaeroides]
MLLVTGITGHSGRHFLQQLIDNSYSGKIRCVVRKNSDLDALNSSGLDIELVFGDLNDYAFVSKAIKNAKTILHIYNIHHSIAIVHAAITNNVERAILVHTTGIYSDCKSVSSEYKRIEEEIFSKSKDRLNLTILRPSMIYGDICDHNMSKFIKMIDVLKIFPLIDDGKCLIQPVNAKDLGKAYYDVLMSPEVTSNKQYNLTGDRPINIKYALFFIRKHLNKTTIFISVSIKISVCIAYIFKILTLGQFDIVEKVLRMGEDRAYSHELAKKDFGYHPMSFEEGIQNEIIQFKIGKQR